MCNVTYFQHKTCKHKWAVVSQPCGPGMGFSTCELFGNGAAKEATAMYKTKSRLCPRCDLGGVYDRNVVRVVEKMGWGVKWGAGPARDDWGFELKMEDGCVML